MSASQPLLLSVFPNFDIGGPQVRFTQLINHHGLGWRHAIVSINGRVECAERIAPHLDVCFPNVAPQPGGLLNTLRQIGRTLSALKPDVLVTHNWGSMEWVLANQWVGVRHVHVEDGFGPEERSAQLGRRIVLRRLVLRRSTVILPSLTLMKIARDTWRLPSARLRHVPNAIDLGRFGPPASSRWARAQTPRIGAVAALRPEKNLSRLLRVARLLVDDGLAFSLEIIGDGPERPRLEALTAQLNLTDVVSFAGALQEPASAYRTLDVFALTSDTEQMPLSVIEAMATGLPVVATRVGDVAQMLAAENQPFVCEQDDWALAAAFEPLLRDAALRRRVGAANRAKAEQQFDQRAMFRAYAEALTPGATRATASRPNFAVSPTPSG